METDVSWADIKIKDKRCNLGSEAMVSGRTLILSVAAVLK